MRNRVEYRPWCVGRWVKMKGLKKRKWIKSKKKKIEINTQNRRWAYPKNCPVWKIGKKFIEKWSKTETQTVQGRRKSRVATREIKKMCVCVCVYKHWNVKNIYNQLIEKKDKYWAYWRNCATIGRKKLIRKIFQNFKTEKKIHKKGNQAKCNFNKQETFDGLCDYNFDYSSFKLINKSFYL